MQDLARTRRIGIIGDDGLKRDRLIEAPTRAGRFSPRLAWFGLFVAAGGVAAARLGDVGPWEVIAVICSGWALSAIALLLSVIGLTAVWRNGLRGGAAAFHGLVVGCLALMWPVSLGAQLWWAPELGDVSTDTTSPPEFSSTPQAIAARGGVTPAAPPANQRALQERAQVLALPLFMDQQPADALKAAETAARSLGWKITGATVSPGGGGQFEAIARSDLLRFPQYVAARVRPTADGAQLDVRSVSEFGKYSPGANLRRILDLHEAVQGVESD